MGDKHTPGPWDYHGPSKPTPDAPEGGDYAIMDGGTNIIAEAFFRTNHDNSHNALANARLIAAAPELLAALRGMVAATEWDQGREPHNLTTIGRALRIARAAIAKATSEAPR